MPSRAGGYTKIPRFSILIPAKNGMPYLHTAVASILHHSRDDFELIVGLGSEELDAVEVLARFNDPRLKIVEPPSGLSMTEHWDWLQSKARGDWQMFVGQDDALQAGFFELADELTQCCEALGLNLICSQRAYLHWPNSAFDPDGRGVIWKGAKAEVKVLNLRKMVRRALFTNLEYFALPQMYTSSMFSKSLLERIRCKQGGLLLTCHPQDANLVALAHAFEENYLWSGIPLGWVGSSVKSAGLAIMKQSRKLEGVSESEQALAETYITSVRQSGLKYPEWAGKFELGDVRIYLWQALILTRDLQPESMKAQMLSARFTRSILARSLLNALISNPTSRNSREVLKIARLNKVTPLWLWVDLIFLSAPVWFRTVIEWLHSRIGRLFIRTCHVPVSPEGAVSSPISIDVSRIATNQLVSLPIESQDLSLIRRGCRNLGG